MISLSRTKCKQKRSSPSRDILLEAQAHRYGTAFANLILALTSSWALSTTAGYSFRPPVSSVTFYTLLIHSVVGVIRYGNPQYGGGLRQIYDNTTFLFIVIGIPCYAAQFAIMYKVMEDVSKPFILLAVCVAAGHYIAGFFGNSKRKNSESEWLTSISRLWSYLFVVFTKRTGICE